MASRDAALPTWARPPVMMPAAVRDQPRDEDRHVVGHDVRSIDMSMISYWTIRARLLRVPGVANVAIWGERLKMLQVQVDPGQAQAPVTSPSTRS